MTMEDLHYVYCQGLRVGEDPNNAVAHITLYLIGFRTAENHPHVDRGRYLAWRSREHSSETFKMFI